MRNIASWGAAAVVAGVLAPAAWACGPSLSRATGPTHSTSATAAARRPANMASAPSFAALAAGQRATVSYQGSGQNPSLALSGPATTVTTSAPLDQNPLLK